MTAARALLLSLVVLLALTCVGLVFGRGGLPQVISLRARLAAQDRANELARERNRRLAAEIDDLRDGLDSIENRARSELGLIKPDEIMVVVAQAR